MINPYACYILGFLVSMVVYQLGWSEAYPSLSFSLVIFLAVTIFVHALLSRMWQVDKQRSVKPPLFSESRLNPWLVTAFLYVCWGADFIRDGIPLVKMILNIPFDYKLFGVPALHVFVVSFTSFYCTYLFQLFLSSREKRWLFLYLINMGSAILICSRAVLFFNLSSSFFLYLLYLDKIPYKKMLAGVPVIVLLFYLFGAFGTARVSFESQTGYDKNSFLDNGKASSQFRSSIVPSEFFWPYIYISSPLANLQVNVNNYPVKPITTTRVLEYINNEWLFESISKRINKLFGVEREGELTIKEPFNVSTVYSRSFSYLGWAGIIAMALFVMAIPLLYYPLIARNPYQTVAVAILCTSYLFLSYDNTIRLMGLGFQLVYPILFPVLENKLTALTSRR